MGKILFTEQSIKYNFIAAANRNEFVTYFNHVVFYVVDFVDGYNVRFVYPYEFFRVK
jgi:hypothetical protein